MVGVSPHLGLLHGGLGLHYGESDGSDAVKTREAAQALQMGLGTSGGPWYLTIAPLGFKPGTWDPFLFDASVKRDVQICESYCAVDHNKRQRHRLVLPGAFSAWSSTSVCRG
jgi:hypothetical protein